VAWAGGCLSYGGYADKVAVATEKLRRQGVCAGDRVALLAEASLESLVVVPALFRLGAVVFPVNTRFPSAYVAELLERIPCAWCLCEGGDAPANVTSLKWPALTGDAGADGWVDADAPATIVLTSGSSGFPKAVVHSVGNHLAAGAYANENMPLSPGKGWLLSLPFCHVAGLAVLFRCWLGGAAVCLPNSGKSLLENLRSPQVSHLSLVPTQLHRLLEERGGEEGLSELDAILVGGAPLSEGLARRAHEAGLRICPSYGLTETGSQITAVAPGSGLEDCLSAGTALCSEGVALSEEGEVLVGGPALFLGYLEVEALAKPFDEVGRFATGDLASIDDAGRLHVTGRRDNRFIVGGENVQPEQVEAVLAMCAGVEEVIVAPRADAEYGAVPEAFVRVAPGASLDGAAYSEGLAGALPKYMHPRRYHPWPKDLAQLGPKAARQALVARLGK
jgi:o-succinylbenzoate---CoA ligase